MAIEREITQIANGLKVGFKKGEDFPRITVNFNKPYPGATICCNFKTFGYSPVIFEPNFVMSADGLSAVNDEVLKLEFNPGKYFADFTLITAEGKDFPIIRFSINIESTTC